MKILFYIILLQLLTTHAIFSTEIGINYHAYTSNFKKSVFLPKYHEKNIRNLVIKQLKEMKRNGVDSIFTHIFIGAPKYRKKHFRKINEYLTTFPPNPQDITNLQNYITDVKDLNITLDLGFLWLGQADFNLGCIHTEDDGDNSNNIKNCTFQNIGHGKLKPSKFLKYGTETITSIFKMPNISYVRNFYFDGEVIYHPNLDKIPIGEYRKKRRNENWFFENIYSVFATHAIKNNIIPTIYFLPTKPDQTKYTYGILNDIWNNLNTQYPSLKGHRSMYAPLHSLLFIRKIFKKNKWPKEWMPKEYSTSFYLDGEDINQSIKWITKYLDDIEFVLESNGFDFSAINAVETGHLLNCQKQDILNKKLKQTNLKSIIYWTTPFRYKRKKIGNTETSYLLDSGCNYSNLFDQSPIINKGLD